MDPKCQLLLVEDSRTQAALIRAHLESAGYIVRTAGDGLEAMELIRQQKPDAIITDLQMPNMNGQELVEAVVQEQYNVPIILVTGVGSEEIASRALRAGAASYVPKNNIKQDIIPTLRRILSYATAEKVSRRLAERLSFYETRYELSNDETLIPIIISQLQDNLEVMGICGEGEGLQVGMALDEALVNAIHHGNLEAPSSLRDVDDGAPYSKLIRQRLATEPYSDRSVHLTFRADRNEAMFVIRDEGPGFDPRSIPDPTDPENLDKVSGRGLLLINTFMDEVSHNETGNEITMVKRAKPELH